MKRFKALLMAMAITIMSLGSVITAEASTVITEATPVKEATVAVTIPAGTIVSSFTITVPNTCALTVDGGAKTATKTFNIVVAGDIMGTETVSISGIKTFNLTQAGVSPIPVTLKMSKDGSFTDISTTDTFTVADDGWKVSLSAAEVASTFNVQIKLDASGITAGAFAGNASFKASLN